jgi:hypothetical protein
VPLTEVETGLLKVILAEDNIFGLPPGTELESVGHGWVVVLHPLRPGTHHLILRTAGTYVSPDGPVPIDQTVTTTIIVNRRP